MMRRVPLGGDSEPQSARGRIAGRPGVALASASGLATVVVVFPTGSSPPSPPSSV
jgi:hypothetical protein